jgi:hypothetical protein
MRAFLQRMDVGAQVVVVGHVQQGDQPRSLLATETPGRHLPAQQQWVTLLSTCLRWVPANASPASGASPALKDDTKAAWLVCLRRNNSQGMPIALWRVTSRRTTHAAGAGATLTRPAACCRST